MNNIIVRRNSNCNLQKAKSKKQTTNFALCNLQFALCRLPFAFCLLLFAFCNLLKAQPLNSARPEVLLQVAEERKEQKDYYNALTLYEKYYEQTKDRTVGFEIAQMHASLRDYAKAETWFARVLQRDKNATGTINPLARFYYAQMLNSNGKYEDAIPIYEDYLKEATDSLKIQEATNAIAGAKMAIGMKENLQIVVENAGPKINGPNIEYSPSITRDGSTLYYSTFKSKEMTKLDGKEGDYYLKIFSAKKDANGEFGKPEVANDNLNRAGNNHGSVYIAPDSTTLFFTRIVLSGNEVTESKLFTAKKQSDGNFNEATEVKGLNGNYQIKHPCVGELYGKEVLFFSSNMEPTKGGFDIFYATKNDDGSYGTPTNAGSVINTFGNEETPFYRDGKLYFSSTGHPGLGNYDLFVSSWNGLTWSEPENLGKGINSSADDKYPSFDDEGTMYLASNRPGGKSIKSKTCCEDIYVIKKAPIKIDLIVNATDGKNPLRGLTFSLLDMTGGKSSDRDDKTADSYTGDLKRSRAYTVITAKPGYYNDTIQFNTVGINQTSTIKKLVTLRPLPNVTASLRAVTTCDGVPLKAVKYILTQVEDGQSATRTVDMFSAALGLRKTYQLIATKEGYTADTVRFSTMDIKTTTTIEKTLKLKTKTVTISRSERIRLQNMYYKLDKYKADEEDMEDWSLAEQSLLYLYDVMKKNPDIVIELSSHTDSRGSDSYNLELSQRRADGVKKWMTEKGIEARRMISKGYGETKIVNRCKNGVKCSEEEHLRNRRTEFRIISGPDTIEIIEQKSAVEIH